MNKDKIIKFFKDLEFDEPKHIYSVKGKRINSSVSRLVKLFVKHTNFNTIAENIDKRDLFITKFVESEEPSLEGNELARELQARAVGNILLEKNADEYLSRAKELFENELEKALPDLPEDVAIDVATEPLKMARQARSGLMENAFLAKDWELCINEAEHGRSIIPDYLLYQPHREGYPIEFVAKGMNSNDKDLIIKGFEMQEEFLQQYDYTFLLTQS